MVVFDMAGTVVDEQNIVYKSLHQSLFQSGVDLEYDVVLTHGAGKEKKQAIADLLVQANMQPEREMIDTIYNAFKEQLMDKYAYYEITSQPGTEQTFDALRSRGILITLNTGYDRATAEMLLQELNWQQGVDIDYLVTASDVQHGRPAPDMIQNAMDALGIETGEEVMKVGDSTVDIEEGRHASCRYNVGITTGAHTREQLLQYNPTHVIDSLAEILPILDQE